MGNTINVGGIAGYYNSYIQTQKSKEVGIASDKGSFSSMAISGANLAESNKKVAISAASGIQETGITSVKDMTLEEYKVYISEKISSYKIHPSIMGDNISISISEAGYKAMQSDPEYEKWVMDSVKGMLTNEYPNRNRTLTGTLCCVASFGASKEECRCLSWSEGYQNGNGKSIWENESEDSVWKSRDSKKNLSIMQEKRAEKKRQQEKELAEMAIERRREYQRITNMHFRKANDVMNQENTDSTSYNLSLASATYEANLLYLNDASNTLQ